MTSEIQMTPSQRRRDHTEALCGMLRSELAADRLRRRRVRTITSALTEHRDAMLRHVLATLRDAVGDGEVLQVQRAASACSESEYPRTWELARRHHVAPTLTRARAVTALLAQADERLERRGRIHRVAARVWALVSWPL